jgi:hypothetical protein
MTSNEHRRATFVAGFVMVIAVAIAAWMVFIG